jgi:hypothetical protein
MIRRLLVACSLAAFVSVQPLAAQPPAAQSEYVPATQAVPGDQLPAAPLLVTAYAFVWIAAMFYAWTIWKRLDRVEHDIRTLEQRHRR